MRRIVVCWYDQPHIRAAYVVKTNTLYINTAGRSGKIILFLRSADALLR